MRISRFFLMMIVLVGTGCATGGTVQINRAEELLAKSQRYVSSLDQIPYQPINPGKSANFAFDAEATILEEGGKRCFAKGFVLPTLTQAYAVSVTSYKAGTSLDPIIMYPKVRILDKDYTVTRTLPYTDFVFRSLGQVEGLNTVFFVNNRAQSESFLLITNWRLDEANLISSQDNIAGAIPIVVPFPGGFAMWMIRTDKSGPPIKMKASPTGKMTVEIREYRPKKVGE